MACLTTTQPSISSEVVPHRERFLTAERKSHATTIVTADMGLSPSADRLSSKCGEGPEGRTRDVAEKACTTLISARATGGALERPFFPFSVMNPL